LRIVPADANEPTFPVDTPHEVFHLFVVAGIGALYLAIAFYALPAAGG
jgi:predicted membrane channel-forming protein YqfA (hemolysin III family)